MANKTKLKKRPSEKKKFKRTQKEQKRTKKQEKQNKLTRNKNKNKNKFKSIKSNKFHISTIDKKVYDSDWYPKYNKIIYYIHKYFNKKLWKDNEKYYNIVKKINDNYKKVLIKKKGNYYLPKGTKLYHGTLFNKFQVHNNLTYFGLDSNISIWYLLNRDIELWLQINYKNKHKTSKKKIKLILNI